MEATSTDNVMVRQESEGIEGAAMEPSHGGQQPWEQKQMIPTVVTSGDVISLQRDAGETTGPEAAGARKKQVVASSTTGTTKRQRMVQGRAQADDDQLTIEGGQAMAATEDVPKTRRQQDMAAGTKTVSPAPDWLPLGVRIEAKRERASGSSQGWTRCHGIFTATGCRLRGDVLTCRLPQLNSYHAGEMRCGRMEIEQCDVDTAFLYGKLEEEIYMELPEGIRELQELAEVKGEGCSRVCMDSSRHRGGEGEEECIVCLYVDDMLIASRQKTVIASVKAGIAEKFRINDLGKARFIFRIEIDYDMERRTLGISQKAYTESIIKKFGQENAKPCLTPLEPGVHLTRVDEPQTEDDKVKMKAKPYRSLVGSLISTEAEYMVLSDCVKECIWMRRLLKDMGVDQVGATVIYEDNQGAMALAKNVGYQARTKHIDIRYHFIREKVASNEVELVYVESKNQLADYLTKGLTTKPLRYLMISIVGPKLETSN
ncbi:unnamed protein product [Phytophthora fragariaefolia]|uniref:Unnamed protein product n=1 Tax=Phytophthora fragariaefolia TaxID=1490495 RepID=A0A9W6XBA9_9STRA|nr:unnamed protein product [Phytophthora fragariaefolia]